MGVVLVQEHLLCSCPTVANLSNKVEELLCFSSRIMANITKRTQNFWTFMSDSVILEGVLDMSIPTHF